MNNQGEKKNLIFIVEGGKKSIIFFVSYKASVTSSIA